jgi:hypothetical protein
VENSDTPPNTANEDDAKKPPGEFVNDELEEQTKRFLEELKDLARRRRAAERDGPPPPGAGQRSRRR